MHCSSCCFGASNSAFCPHQPIFKAFKCPPIAPHPGPVPPLPMAACHPAMRALPLILLLAPLLPPFLSLLLAPPSHALHLPLCCSGLTLVWLHRRGCGLLHRTDSSARPSRSLSFLLPLSLVCFLLFLPVPLLLQRFALAHHARML